MRKLTVRLIVAILTFLLGTTAAAVWFITRRSLHPKVHLVVPNARWEPRFFMQLDEHAKPIGLSNLRTVALPKDDLEVRVWYNSLPDMLDGVVLRRSGDRWSAIQIHGRYKREHFPVEQRALPVPKSGWERAWGRLVSAGVLTLPDASEVGCHSSALDGIGYVVETNTNLTYMTYSYGNPQLMECSEARQVLKVVEILEEEFDMWEPKNWE